MGRDCGRWTKARVTSMLVAILVAVVCLGLLAADLHFGQSENASLRSQLATEKQRNLELANQVASESQQLATVRTMASSTNSKAAVYRASVSSDAAQLGKDQQDVDLAWNYYSISNASLYLSELHDAIGRVDTDVHRLAADAAR
jgi:hypothetical protein